MAKQSDTPVVDETVETTEENVAEVKQTPEVEFDKEIEVMGDVTENPTLDEVEEEVEEPVVPEEPETPEEPEVPEVPAQVAEEVEKDETGVYSSDKADPGDFKPKADYSFEINTTNGKTVKISSQEQADAFAERLDNEEGLVSASQFAKFTRSLARMDLGLERERADYENAKEQFDLQQAQEAVRNEQITQWNNGLNYLQSKGLLPEITAGMDVPGGWEKNPDDPGVKARMEIFSWMDRENRVRQSAGIDPVMNVVDAFSLMKAEQTEDNVRTERTRDKSERQARGKMVSGSSPYTESNAPNNSIIGEGGSLQDLITEASMGM